MKYIILVPDGAADVPIEDLNGRTCLEAADTSRMDTIARKGVVGTVKNVPRGMIPASDVANLSILGYDPAKYYCGRGPLEAANIGIELGECDVAFRFNTVTVSDGKMVDYSAGHISSKESAVLVDALNKKLGSKKYRFYAGVSYRNLLVVTCDFPEEAAKLAKIMCYPPHDILDQAISKHLPKDPDILDLVNKSREVLEEHDINKVRVDLGQNPANMIWPWGQGRKPNMPSYKEAFGISGGIISAVDLLKGMGRVLGLDVVNVEGATGYYDTNYEGKADAALKLLENHDLVFVHVEAPDEAGHNGDILAKIKAIENFDKKIVGRIIDAIGGRYDYRVLVLPDHPTPVKKRTHTADAVPFAICGPGIEADEVSVFTEEAAKAGSMELKHGYELIKYMIDPSKKNKRKAKSDKGVE
ncbi:MAG TPA: cofactor-independent phosphoglycerate mutase [Candidatus Omnitrophota bacterium]|mgnify:CR=1 FL=1|nr:cofactor-independent phosphoglycerate mutase [Candidatus Omnitrophota bacterium]HPS20143.1 cofactor-independent phosphoglycerate mutase [Candidatus Omnitrophota bacterium]